MAFMVCECCVGACCKDGDCTPETQQDCLDLGGTFLGYGVQCYEGICDGACCAPDGTCTTTYREACTDEFIGEGVGCDPNPCPQPCTGDEDCAPCECCEDGACETAVCQEPVIDIDTWSWCGSNLGFGDIGVSAMGDICASGSVECEDPAATYTFTTKYYFQWFGLIETVECGGTQTTSPGSFPSIPSGHCRYIYRMGGGFGQSSSLADSCKARYWWAYVDVDPCEAPASGSMTLVEDTAAAVNNAAISDCEEDNTPGCRSGCDTDVDDCFSTPPSIPINPAP